MDTLITALYFLIVLGIAIIFHELGHFAVAKWVGVRVEKFSIGFGKKLFSIKYGETEYIIAPIPMGGYVKLAGDNPEEELAGQPWEFLSVSPFKRMLIVLAGPGMNILSALILIFMVIFLFGVSYVKSTTVGNVYPQSPAEKIGILPGDEIQSVNGSPVESWDDLIVKLGAGFISENPGDVQLAVKRGEKSVNLTIPSDSIKKYDLYRTFPPLIKSVEPGSPADKGGITAGSLIIKAKGKPIDRWEEFASEVGDEYKPLPNGEFEGLPINVEWKTESGEIKSATIVPNIFTDKDKAGNEKQVARLGVYLKFPVEIVLNNNIISSIGISPKIKPVVGRVQDEGPADKAGLKDGDVIVALNGEDTNDWFRMLGNIWESYEKVDENNAVGKPIELTWMTEKGDLVTKTITPEVQKVSLPTDLSTGETSYLALIGVRLKDDRRFPGILGSIGYSAKQTYRMSLDFFDLMYRIFSGQIKAKAALGGPIAIFKISGQQGRWGMESFIHFIAILCVNLGWINLLPIPILDGGHILLYSVEAVRRKSFTIKQLEWAQKIGMMILLPLIVFIFFIDFSRYGWFQWIGKAIMRLFGVEQ